MRSEMRLRTGLLAIVAIAAVSAATLGAAADAGNTRAASRLRAFDSCPSFVAYARQHALPLVGPWGIGGGAVGMRFGALPPSAARDAIAGAKSGAEIEFSGTNVQEQGVDEPDLVKTNGRTLFVLSGAGVSALDVRTGKPRLLQTLKLESGATELLLHGNRLLALGQGAPIGIPIDAPTGIRAPWPYPSRSTITEIDVGNPSRMRVARTLELEGGYLAARLVGRAARIVLSSPMGIDLPFVQPVGTEPGATARATEQNKAVARAAEARRWLPGYTLKSASGRVTGQGRIVQCRNVRRPPIFAGLGMLTVLTIDVERGLDPIDSDAVVSDGRVVYASKSRLYVATERWDKRLLTGRPIPGETSTAIHAFDIASPTRTHYVASGNVMGVLLNQWSLSERNGILRVASTEQPVWWGGPRTESETSVTTFGEQAGALVQLGRVGGLGKGERVYAVRFIGDVGYVVTFRQVDPLYTLDLSLPSRPLVRGELKILGYSAYLHPVGDDLLLGIGQDATEDGRVLGTQASLFDVSDIRSPKRLDAFSVGKGWSEAEHDHHAFLWWPRTRLAVLPVQAYGESQFAGALGLRVRRADGLQGVGRVSHPGHAANDVGAAIRRSVVVGDVLYTVSDVGVKASALSSFADLGFARLAS